MKQQEGGGWQLYIVLNSMYTVLIGSTMQSSVVPAMVDRWCHLVLLSLGQYVCVYVFMCIINRKGGGGGGGRGVAVPCT